MQPQSNSAAGAVTGGKPEPEFFKYRIATIERADSHADGTIGFESGPVAKALFAVGGPLFLPRRLWIDSPVYLSPGHVAVPWAGRHQRIPCKLNSIGECPKVSVDQVVAAGW